MKPHIKLVDGNWLCIGENRAAFAETPSLAWHDAMGYTRPPSDWRGFLHFLASFGQPSEPLPANWQEYWD